MVCLRKGGKLPVQQGCKAVGAVFFIGKTAVQAGINHFCIGLHLLDGPGFLPHVVVQLCRTSAAQQCARHVFVEQHDNRLVENERAASEEHMPLEPHLLHDLRVPVSLVQGDAGNL